MQAAWSDLSAMLLRETIYELQLLRWSQVGKGAKPKRIPLPGESNPDASTFGSEPVEMEEIDEFFGRSFAVAA